MAARRIIDVPKLCNSDIRALEVLLKRHHSVESEFHRLLEDYPAILSVLGYVKLLSEQPIPKLDGIGNLARYKDRPDILAARHTCYEPSTLYVDIIELKAVNAPVTNSDSPQRWSEMAGKAVSQLASYERELTRSGEFQTELLSVGLRVAEPRKILVL